MENCLPTQTKAKRASEELLGCSIFGSPAERTKHYNHHHYYYFYWFEEYGSQRTFLFPNQKSDPYLTPCLAKRLGRMSLGYHNLSCDQRDWDQWSKSYPVPLFYDCSLT